MKKQFWIINILLVCVHLNMFSQTEKGFRAGIMGGIVPSQVDGDSYGGYGKIGLQAGLFSIFQTKEQMYWQIAIKWMQKGSLYKKSKLGIYYSLKLNYIDIPITYNYIYKKKFLCMVGLSYGYLFKSLEDKDGYGGMEPVPPMNKSDLEGLIGLGYYFSSNLLIMNTLGYSMLPIRNYPGGQKYWFNRGWANNLISIALYYKL